MVWIKEDSLCKDCNSIQSSTFQNGALQLLYSIAFKILVNEIRQDLRYIKNNNSNNEF